MKKVVGQITLSGKTAVVDAEPHVMSMVRRVFGDVGKSRLEQGRYTHKVERVPVNGSTAKDLLWVTERYPMEFAKDARALVEGKAAEYDRILEATAQAAEDPVLRTTSQALSLGVPLREHQVRFVNFHAQVKRALLADTLGLGKTASALGTLLEPSSRPAVVVCPPHLCTQWEREVKRFLPAATTHVIKGFKTYALPDVDVTITSYNRLKPWQDVLMSRTFHSVVFDEVHDLRKTETEKRAFAHLLSTRAQSVVGLSATPIYNLGQEIWSVLDVVRPGCLGEEAEFSSEWCDWGRVREPSTLNSYLRSQGLMLRRTPEETDLGANPVNKHVFTLDADLQQLAEVRDVARTLALSIVSNVVGTSDDSAREFDWKLRHATGVAKARPAAEFVRMICEQGEKVVLCAWHRDVYEVLLKSLSHYKPVMYTGTESVKEKDEAIKAFVEGDSQVLVLSLRSGAGIDGLQRVCSTIVFAELDWSPHVTDQCVGRLARPGQTRSVQAYYLTIPDGSDPFIMGLLNVKRSQHDGLVEGRTADAEILEAAYDPNRVREMARAFLEGIGEKIPEPVKEEGLLGDLAGVLRRLRVPTTTEEEMQEAVARSLPGALPDAVVEREHRVGKRSRLDFLVTRGEERIALELKATSADRAEVYRQVRRYAKEANVRAVVLLAPWAGVGSFVVDGIPVVVIDPSRLSL